MNTIFVSKKTIFSVNFVNYSEIMNKFFVPIEYVKIKKVFIKNISTNIWLI